MSFNNYKLFTCTSLFEPAVFSSHGGLDKEAVVGLRAEVSIPGPHSPEDYKEGSTTTALVKTFLSLLGAVVAGDANYNENPQLCISQMKEALDSHKEDPYAAFILKWTSCGIEGIIEDTPISSLSSALLVSLLEYYEKNGNSLQL